jgi:hypothetical protein
MFDYDYDRERKLLESISKVFFNEVLSVCYCFQTAGGIHAEENTRGENVPREMGDREHRP